MVPSRQLGIQVMRAAHALLPADLRPLVQQCIGGASQTRQLQALRSRHRPFLVVGTPGRLLELAAEESLKLWQCPLLVLDEVRKPCVQKTPGSTTGNDLLLFMICTYTGI